MHTVIGPILTREGGCAYDFWTPEEGLSRGYSYRRIEDAHYARNVEIRSRTSGYGRHMVACSTVDEFTSALAEYHNPLRTLVTSPQDCFQPVDRSIGLNSAAAKSFPEERAH
jgi:hypothetical protein